MNDKPCAGELRAALDRRLAGLRADPLLARRIMAGEAPAARRAFRPAPAAVIAIVLLCLLMTGALAAALLAWGIVDFAARPSDAFVPPGYAGFIVPHSLTVDAGAVTCTVQESYYDGQLLRITAHVVPKGKLLLIGGDASPQDPAGELFPDAQGMSIAEYALAHFGGHLADVSLYAGRDDTHSFLPHADGSVTLYTECRFEDELPVRTPELWLVCMPVRVSPDASFACDASAREITPIPVTFTAAETLRCTCTEALAFPGAGVQVTRVELTVTPLEIRYALDYAVTDPAAFTAQQGGLWFEFVDPAGGLPASSGLSSSGSVGRAEGAHGAVYRQTGAIGLDALGGEYALRAYNAMSKTRYETVTFRVSER